MKPARRIQCEQRGPEWIRLHVGTITASGVPAIMLPPTKRASTREGVSFPAGSEARERAEYRENKVLERLYGVAVENYVTPAMKHGIYYEPFACQLYEAMEQEPLEEIGFAFHPEWDWLGCSPDRIVNGIGGLEAKCPTPKVHEQYFRDVSLLVADYRAQVLTGLAVFKELDWWDLISFHPNAPIDHKIVKAPRFHRSDWKNEIEEVEEAAAKMNKEIEDELEQRGYPRDFWQRHYEIAGYEEADDERNRVEIHR